MALVFLELALVLFTVRPDEVADTMHFVVEPLASVLLLVAPNVSAFALNFVHLELALVD